MHGDPPEIVGRKIADMRERRERLHLPPMIYGVAGYAIVRDTEAEAQREVARITDVQQSARGYQNYQQWVTGSKLEQKISLEDYSVSNRGLRSGLVGTPQQVKERVAALSDAGVDLLLLQSSPQREEMERFAAQVMPAR
jgi:FMNH2-dependent dimethyl sulfone monooxygenase